MTPTEFGKLFAELCKAYKRQVEPAVLKAYAGELSGYQAHDFQAAIERLPAIERQFPLAPTIANYIEDAGEARKYAEQAAIQKSLEDLHQLYTRQDIPPAELAYAEVCRGYILQREEGKWRQNAKACLEQYAEWWNRPVHEEMKQHLQEMAQGLRGTATVLERTKRRFLHTGIGKKDRKTETTHYYHQCDAPLCMAMIILDTLQEGLRFCRTHRAMKYDVETAKNWGGE